MERVATPCLLTILWTHVGNSCPVSYGEGGNAGTIELHKLAHYTHLPRQKITVVNLPCNCVKSLWLLLCIPLT